MATRKRPTGRKSKQETPGWAWMLFGLSIGLVIAAAVYVSDRPAAPPMAAQQATPDGPQPGATAPASGEPTAAPGGGAAAEAVPPHPATRFDFYDMLPQFEIVIPEVEISARPDRRATAVAEPGSYVLQAGSFRTVADADRMRASLALLGIESRVQRVAIDEDIYHRVRIGPTDDLDDLNTIRRRLWDAEIEVMLIKVPD
jgi:cell division protein FtsN